MKRSFRTLAPHVRQAVQIGSGQGIQTKVEVASATTRQPAPHVAAAISVLPVPPSGLNQPKGGRPLRPQDAAQPQRIGTAISSPRPAGAPSLPPPTQPLPLARWSPPPRVLQAAVESSTSRMVNVRPIFFQLPKLLTKEQLELDMREIYKTEYSDQFRDFLLKDYSTGDWLPGNANSQAQWQTRFKRAQDTWRPAGIDLEEKLALFHPLPAIRPQCERGFSHPAYRQDPDNWIQAARGASGFVKDELHILHVSPDCNFGSSHTGVSQTGGGRLGLSSHGYSGRSVQLTGSDDRRTGDEPQWPRSTLRPRRLERRLPVRRRDRDRQLFDLHRDLHHRSRARLVLGRC